MMTLEFLFFIRLYSYIFLLLQAQISSDETNLLTGQDQKSKEDLTNVTSGSQTAGWMVLFPDAGYWPVYDKSQMKPVETQIDSTKYQLKYELKK